MRIIGGYQDTRDNKEDFALTPFLFSVYKAKNKNLFSVYGIGFCWGWTAMFIGIAFKLPKHIPSFLNISKYEKNKTL